MLVGWRSQFGTGAQTRLDRLFPATVAAAGAVYDEAAQGKQGGYDGDDRQQHVHVKAARRRR